MCTSRVSSFTIATMSSMLCSYAPSWPGLRAKPQKLHDSTQTLVGVMWRLMTKYTRSPSRRLFAWSAMRPTPRKSSVSKRVRASSRLSRVSLLTFSQMGSRHGSAQRGGHELPPVEDVAADELGDGADRHRPHVALGQEDERVEELVLGEREREDP